MEGRSLQAERIPDAFLDELEHLVDDFEYYAPTVLRIATKDGGGLVPFKLNTAQQYLHEIIEQQKFEYNHVRVLVLKGRQQGISTYAEGRFYWKTQFERGVRAFILTHMQDATDNLFAMVERYHRNCPDDLRPRTGKNSGKVLNFDTLDSGYKVGTAGSKGAGRSGTYKYFHGSEVHFWPTADKHAAGALQTVGSNNGSEVIFESTANGVSGYFYHQWKKAEKGIGDFIAVFIPWFWQLEYRTNPPKDWQPTGQEADVQAWYGLDLEQCYWMHLKNIELGGDPGVIATLFKQEYPCSAAEAFQSTGQDALISVEAIMAARKNTIEDPYGSRVMGVDPARFGNDRTSIIDRKGRKAFNLESFKHLRTTEVAARVALRIQAADEAGDPYQAIFIDDVGIGGGVTDVLVDMGYEDIVVPVNAGSRATNRERYFNKRCEMWGECNDWLDGEIAVDIPDKDSLHADLRAPGFTYNTKQQMVLETKEQMRTRDSDRPSPDEAEALVLTFSFPVNPNAQAKKKAFRKMKRSDWRTA